ncbi:uncharacterized protein LOC127634387 [Xyrauchen texanus]|uniref:uncharacterized protein LOC127634387 n=1 Tax=Xyrauchen texanus TaxID=154827 RepID=UPI0022425156|nr:uncharacterized protein LOC127634387 [Xyrauchen texanus]
MKMMIMPLSSVTYRGCPKSRCMRRTCLMRSHLTRVTPITMALTFIVCQEELMGLFVICPACCERSDSSIMQQEGTFLKIKQVCASCGYHRFWQNQPMLHRNMPTCNLLLSGAIHFTGCLATQTLRMLTLFGLQCISASSYFRHQRATPSLVALVRFSWALLEVWILLSIEDRVNKVVDVQLVQSSEVPNSSWCELEGLKRSVGLLRGKDLHLATLITDRHRQVAKWLREELSPEGTRHYFDVWHIAKSSLAAVKLENIITRTALLKDVRQLSPQHQTFSLEAYHSLILHFAPKHTGFSYVGMYSRLLLAALHYNHNANRETARKSDGTEKYCVRYPGFRKGAHVVRPIQEAASYGYATSLMKALQESYTHSPAALRETSPMI